MASWGETHGNSQQQLEFTTTHYGVQYNGSPMGCTGKLYSTNDATIAAIGPSRYREWPCGTQFLITGPAGSIIATRQDSCPGCHHTLIDLSEAGNVAVCGGSPHTCRVTLEVLD